MSKNYLGLMGLTSEPLQVATVRIAKKMPVWIGHHHIKTKIHGQLTQLTVFEPTDGIVGERLYVDGDRFCWINRDRRLWPVRLLGQAVGMRTYIGSPVCQRAAASRVRPFDNAILHGLLERCDVGNDYPDDAGFGALKSLSESHFRDLEMKAEIIPCSDFDQTEWRSFSPL